MKSIVFATSLLFMASGAMATVITSGPIAPIPATPGTGLQGNYYGQSGIAESNVVPGGNSNSAADQVADNAEAATLVASNSPLGTFLAANASSGGYNQNDGNTLGTFLGADAASLNPPGLATSVTSLNNQIITLTGYIALQAGDNTFSVSSDDGSYVLINGQQVIQNGGAHGPQGLTGTATVTTTGLYAVSVVYYEFGGGTQLSFSPDKSVLYTSVPEPASVGLGIFSVLGLIARRRRA